MPDLQRVADACVAQHGSQPPVVLPFDLCAPHSVMEAQAKTADEAFGSAGVDYMVHVAGEAFLPVRGSLLWGLAATLAWLAGPACVCPRGDCMQRLCEGAILDMPLATSHRAFASHELMGCATCASDILPVLLLQEPASTPWQRTPVPT